MSGGRNAGDAAAVPRTTLFLPVLSTTRVASALAAGADEIVVDLEDAVPPERKAEGRAQLGLVVEQLGSARPVSVRINAEPEHRAADLTACRDAGVAHVVVPKVAAAAEVQRIRELTARIGYEPTIAVLVESCAGVLALPSIVADAGPLRTIALGNEDLRGEIELGAPDAETDSVALAWAHGALVVAARAHGAAPLGIAGSLAELDDLDRLAAGGRAARRMGYLGTYCVHPAQVSVLNAAYSPDSADRGWAERVVAAERAARAAGRGAFRVDGRMVDAPLVARARRILAATPR